MSGGRPWSTRASLQTSTQRVRDHEDELVRRGGVVLHLRISRVLTDKLDLAALHLRTSRLAAARRLIELAIQHRLDH